MADEVKESAIKGAVKGWVKGLVTSVVGLVSGAALMCLTPLVNNVIKPAKPVSNFATQAVGLNVNFNNRSTGATQGWWDFGDGSALEPFDPKLETVAHAYAKPGAYTVMLKLQNLLGDESERTATVNIDGDSAPAKMEIGGFELKAITAGETAPANYWLKAKVVGATHCILCAGDSRNMEIIEEPGDINRLITFEDVGNYTVRLAAVNGKQVIEKNQAVRVGAGETGGVLAKLKVSYEAVRVARYPKTWHIHVGWQGELKDAVSPFRKERPVESGCTISNLTLVNKDDAKAPRNLECKPSPDKTKIVLTGELMRPTGLLAPKQTSPSWLAEVKGMVERRSPAQVVNRDDVTMALAPGRPLKIPLQPLGDGWEPVRAHVSLELWDGTQKLWWGEPPMANAVLTWKNQPAMVTAVQQSDGVVVTLIAATVPAMPVGLSKPAPVDFPPTPVLPPPPSFVPPAPVLPPPAPVMPPPMMMPPPSPSVSAVLPVGPVRVKIDFDPRRPFASPGN